MSAPGIFRPCHAGAMLSSTQLNGGRGGPQERATSATGPGAPGAPCTGQQHRAGRRWGTPEGSDGEEGRAGEPGPASPSPGDATGAQLGVDSGEVAGLYPPGRRPPDRVGGNVPQGDAPSP